MILTKDTTQLFIGFIKVRYYFKSIKSSDENVKYYFQSKSSRIIGYKLENEETKFIFKIGKGHKPDTQTIIIQDFKNYLKFLRDNSIRGVDDKNEGTIKLEIKE